MKNIFFRNIVIRIGFSNTWLDIVHMSEEYLQPERTFSRRGRRIVERGDCGVSYWGWISNVYKFLLYAVSYTTAFGRFSEV